MEALNSCQHCGNVYLWRKSTSRYLKMTYCSQLCEAAEGMTIEDLCTASRDEMKVEARRMVRLFRERYERPDTIWDFFREMQRAGAL